MSVVLEMLEPIRWGLEDDMLVGGITRKETRGRICLLEESHEKRLGVGFACWRNRTCKELDNAQFSLLRLKNLS